MSDFSVTDAAFAGFRVARDHPRALAVWIVAHFVASLVFSVPYVAVVGPAYMQVQALQNGGGANPAASAAVLRMMGPMLLLTIPYSLVFFAVAISAVNRAVLQPENDRYAYLRLSMDEVRQGLLLLLTWLIAFALYLALAVALVFVAVLFGLLIGAAAGSLGFPAKEAAAVIIGLIAVVGLLGGEAFVWVRLSLAWPLTFDRQRVNLFGSWALTRGKFWRMFGAYLLALIFCVMVGLLLFVVDMAISFALGGAATGMRAIFHPDMGSLRAFLTPVRIAMSVVGAIANTLIWLIVLAPSAEIYRRLQPERDASVFA